MISMESVLWFSSLSQCSFVRDKWHSMKKLVAAKEKNIPQSSSATIFTGSKCAIPQ